MSEETVARKSSKKWNICPQGLHQAVCCDYNNLGLVEVTYKGVTSKKVKVDIYWQVNENDPDTGKRFIVRERYTLSLDERAKLRAVLESWRGKPFTEQELEDGFKIENLVNANCMLNIVHNTVANGNTYANAASVVPIPRNMARMMVEDYVRIKDRPKEQEQDETPTEIDDGIPF